MKKTPGIRPGLVVVTILMFTAVLYLTSRTQKSSSESGTSVSTLGPREGRDLGQAQERPAANALGEPSTPTTPGSDVDMATSTTSIQEEVDSGFWARVMDDPQAQLQARLRAARRLAQSPHAEAISVLRQGLPMLPSRVRATIGEALGSNTSAEGREILFGLVDDPDEVVARGAIRGVAAIGDVTAVSLLNEVLSSTTKPESVRGEAALGLGDIPLPEAYDALAQAAVTISDQSVHLDILRGLGLRDFDETRSFFAAYLSDISTAGELRATAVEALAEAKGSVEPFLLSCTADPDPAVRAEAAWALSARDVPGDYGPTLLQLLETETDSEVRRRIYQALENQSNADPSQGFNVVLAEKNTETRLAGFQWLAGVIESSGVMPLRAEFLDTVIPELQRLALNADSSADRMSAAMALGRLHDSAAFEASRQILEQSQDERVRQIATQHMQVAYNNPSTGQ